MATKHVPRVYSLASRRLGIQVIQLANEFKQENRTFRECLELAAKLIPKDRFEYYPSYRALGEEVMSFVGMIGGRAGGRKKTTVRRAQQPKQMELFTARQQSLESQKGIHEETWRNTVANMTRTNHGLYMPDGPGVMEILDLEQVQG